MKMKYVAKDEVKKRFLAVILIVVMLFALAACGSGSEEEEKTEEDAKVSSESENDESSSYMSLDYYMVREIEDEISAQGWKEDVLFRALLTNRLLGLDDEYTFTDFSITSQKKTDSYTYTVYGRLYYTDNYARTKYTTARVEYQAEQDSDSDSGYKISYKLYFD